MSRRRERVWEVFHGLDLDQLVDRAHGDAPHGFVVNHVNVQYLNAEYVVTAVYER